MLFSFQFFKNSPLSAQRLTKSQDFAILKQHKKNTHSSSGRSLLLVAGRKICLGIRKQRCKSAATAITVTEFLNSQVGMLIVLCYAKRPLGKRRVRNIKIRQGIFFMLCSFKEGCFCCFSCKKLRKEVFLNEKIDQTTPACIFMYLFIALLRSLYTCCANARRTCCLSHNHS